MAISEKDLLEAGFSKSEVDNLQGRLAAGGGTMQHLIEALSRRFRVSAWITVALVLVMLVTLIAGSRTHILSGGMSSLVVLIIAWVTFPPAENYFPEGSIVSKSSATLALTPHPAILSAIAGRGVLDTFLKKSGLVQYHSRCASGFSLRPYAP